MTGRVTATLCSAVTFINLRYRNIVWCRSGRWPRDREGTAGQPPASAASPPMADHHAHSHDPGHRGIPTTL